MVLFSSHPKLNEVKNYINKFPEIFQVIIPQNWEENRILTDKQFYKILEKSFITIEDYTNNDDLWILTEILHYINPSLAIKIGVNIILFGGALNFLGTEKHKSVLQEIITGKKVGCFAMTEIGHGSNLKGLKTTAKKVKNKLLINSPDDESVKCWIGGSTIADYSVVFCQLYDEKDVYQGLHAVLVPMNLPGIECTDMGAKLGLNGVDNGFIRFTNIEVPIENLLDKYGGFDENGHYSSTIKNKDIRFGKMLSALSVGRISIAIGSYAIAYKSFIIALKYNLERKQFTMKNEKDEKRIIEYTTQICKFSNIYSCLYHMRLGLLDLIQTYKQDGITKKLHAVSSLLKVFNTWKAVEITNSCRQMCGGHGYLWSNQLGMLMSDVNVYQTFEGDNTVLIQQGVKWILSEFKNNNLSLSYVGNKVNLQIRDLASKLVNAKNVEKCWLDNLQQVVALGIDYTYLHLIKLSHKEEILWRNVFKIYIDKNKIDSYTIQYILKEQIFERIVQEWDNIHKERTVFIPLTKYPVYLKSLL